MHQKLMKSSLLPMCGVDNEFNSICPWASHVVQCIIESLFKRAMVRTQILICEWEVAQDLVYLLLSGAAQMLLAPNQSDLHLSLTFLQATQQEYYFSKLLTDKTEAWPPFRTQASIIFSILLSTDWHIMHSLLHLPFFCSQCLLLPNLSCCLMKLAW